MDAVLQSLGASAAQELETDQANKKIWLIKVRFPGALNPKQGVGERGGGCRRAA